MAVGYAAAFEQGSLHGAVVREGKVRRLFATNARGQLPQQAPRGWPRIKFHPTSTV